MKALILYDLGDVEQINSIASEYDQKGEKYTIYCLWKDVYDEIINENKELTDFAVDISKSICFSDLCNEIAENVSNDSNLNSNEFVFESIKLFHLDRYIHFFVYSVLLHHLIVFDYIAKNKKINEFILIDGKKNIDNNQWWQGYAYKAPMYAVDLVGKRYSIGISKIKKPQNKNTLTLIKNKVRSIFDYSMNFIGVILGGAYNKVNDLSKKSPSILVCNIGAIRQEYDSKYKYSLILGEESNRFYRGVLGLLMDFILNKKTKNVSGVIKFGGGLYEDNLVFNELSNKKQLYGYDVNKYIVDWLQYVINNRYSFYKGVIKDTNKLILKGDIKAVIALNTSHGFPNVVFTVAKNKNIPTFEILHGIPSFKYAFLPVRPKFTIAMGGFDAKFTGINSFISVGTRKISNIKHQNINSKTILYAAVRNEKKYGTNVLDSGYMDYEIDEMLSIINNALKKITDFDLDIKYCPGHPDNQYDQHNKFAEDNLTINYNIVDNKISIKDYIQQSFCVITYDSTVVIEAISLGVPVILLNAKAGYFLSLDNGASQLLFAETSNELHDAIVKLKNNYYDVLSRQHDLLKCNYELASSKEVVDRRIANFINDKI